MNYITLLPPFSPSVFFKKKRNVLADEFLKKKNVYFLQTGREALKLGLSYLKILSNDRILIPAYICQEVTKAIKTLKIDIDYYQIFNNLNPDFNDIQAKITPKTKAILMVHYFGFPQPIEEFENICKKYNLKLIEDCAHTFLGRYANKFLGTFGDISFFSLRKIFALPDGGILVTAKDAPLLDVSETKIRSRAIGALLLEWLISSTGLRWLNLLRRIMVSHNKNLATEEKILQGISSFSKKFWQNYNWQNMVQQRRNNYLYLSHLLMKVSGIKLLYPELLNGVAPYALPIITEDRIVKKNLYKNGILADSWPDLPEELDPKIYKTTFYLAENGLLLPIHQRLNEEKLKFIAKVFSKVK